MGQLCCFPFSRDEEKISELESPSSIALQRCGREGPSWASGDKNGGEPDDAELVRLSKRLVENAVLKAVQQYLEETQNKNKPGDGSSVKAEEADRNGTDSDDRK
ncbi:A-kinase anchoring protein 7 isoform X4 [Cervus elaphus]|uniref:A-kinase anchoring protein 7 isoform X4 n=1 Tax=Cervus canadensis TaxID=1574408 RepID=UPI0018B846DD|nr:A-kinase anchoring protein 7 isoform X4 [Cervus canadensis]XP_043744389.1 A-kinase anchoring protein 7 isoform X4 [Cervus elaphus]